MKKDMCDRQKITMVFLIVFGIVSSCTTVRPSVQTATTPIPVNTGSVFDPHTPTFTLPPTQPTLPTQTKIVAVFSSNLTLTPVDIFTNPNQVTDGKLKMFIEEPVTMCHGPGEIIEIKIQYENLTEKPLVLVDFDIVSTQPLFFSRGIILPILTTTANERIRFADDIVNMDLINPNSPLLHEISPESSFEYLAKYYLSGDSGEFNKNQQFSVLPSGQYGLRFVYYAQQFPEAWDGVISSNQLIICVS